MLPRGKTVYTTFKIPIDLESAETLVCGISSNFDIARVLQECSLIDCDECTRARKKASDRMF